MGKNFTLYVPGFRNNYFTKDLGIIPIIFSKYYNYNSVILTYKNEENYDEAEKNNIGIAFIEDDSVVQKVLEDTDILMLFGYYEFNLNIIERYKAIKPQGKIYLKLDMNIHWLRRIMLGDRGVNLLKQCTLISIECKNLYKYINEIWPVKVEYIPNGYYLKDERIIDYKEKENTILTVGRLGTYEKANDVLLQAFRLCSEKLGNWKLKLIGGIENSFQSYITDFMAAYPNLKDKISFTGLIKDQKLLEQEYAKAKIFCLTSLCEGFPNVFSEAATKGCYIVSSDIDSAWDITRDKAYGSIFPINDVQALAAELITVCSDEKRLERVCKETQVYSRDIFNWMNLCKKMEEKLNNNELFSVLIISYNNLKYVYQCLDSIFEQSYPFIEIIISDDCSKDFDKEKIEDYIKTNKKENIVNYVINQNPSNMGTVKNVNNAIRLATGNYLIDMACDDILYDDNVIRDIAFYLCSTKSLIMVGYVAMYDESLKTCELIYPAENYIGLISGNPFNCYINLCNGNFIPASGVAYKRELIEKYGLYDEEYQLMDDYPRWLSLTRNGCKIDFFRRFIAKWRKGGITTSSGKEEVNKKLIQDLELTKEKEILPYVNKI